MPRRKTLGADVPQDTAAMLQQIETLQRALVQKAAEAEALKLAARSGTGDGVLVENTGVVQVAISVSPDRTIILDSHGPRRTALIPVHVYESLKRETDWFDLGYLMVSGEPITNPNVILDAEAWIERHPEEQIDEAIAAITSEGALHILWDRIESREHPTGKELKIKRAITKRTGELLGYDLVEDYFG